MNKKETTRYAQFCQFRQNIRGSKDYLIVLYGLNIYYRFFTPLRT